MNWVNEQTALQAQLTQAEMRATQLDADALAERERAEALQQTLMDAEASLVKMQAEAANSSKEQAASPPSTEAAVVETVQTVSPIDAPVVFQKALALRKEGEFAEALPLFEEIVEKGLLESHVSESLFFAASLHEALGRADQAVLL